MVPFLYQVAKALYNRLGSDIRHLALVFPNRRAGLFFQKYLSEVAGRPLFSPTILTIGELFGQLSGLQQADRIRMLCMLYKLYLEQSGREESFDDFLYWGEMLLGDFDDVDKYMTDAKMLFRNIEDLKELDQDYSYLSEEQIAAIRSFWSTFFPKGESTNQQAFLAVWQLLYGLYTDLRKALLEQGVGYEGMVFRQVVEDLEGGKELDLPYRQIVFVGLNALSTAEERLLKQLQQRGVADFYWDYAAPMVADPKNRSAYFMQQNLTLFPSLHPLPKESFPPIKEHAMRLIAIPSGIGQAKQLYHILQELAGKEPLVGERALRTAVVLPDEQMLIPVLNAIPEEVARINVTMGYPLTGTPIAALMEFLIMMQRNVRYVDGKAHFYHKDVLPVLNHRYVMTEQDRPVIANVIHEMTAGNRIYVSIPELAQTPLLEILFREVQTVDDFSDYLIQVLQALNRSIGGELPEEESENYETEKNMLAVEQEFVFHYFKTVNRLQEVVRDAGVEMRLDTYFRLLKRLTDMITVPFHGEPLSGLQVMGVLETRALDFDRLIILSMNEGVFPQKKVPNTFIPYNLRRGFGLPTYEHQDSIWAYHFYRLISRAQQVTMLYDTRNNGLQTGEVSRFVHQLQYHYEVPIQKNVVVYQVATASTEDLRVEKTPEVMRRLEAFFECGDRALSASAINNYLDCPLKFYFLSVEGIEEEEEVSETIGSDLFGSILHRVMEKLYAPFCGKPIKGEYLKAMRENLILLNQTIASSFAEIVFKTDTVRPLTGQNYLIGEVIRKYVMRILERDALLTPFLYIGSEIRIHQAISLSDGRKVNLKGFIDRVDEVEGRLRIVDYKTGKGKSKFPTVESLFDKENKVDRPKAVMQVFLYAWMVHQRRKNRVIRPAIYYMRTLFEEQFDSSIYHDKLVVDDFANYAVPFEESLRVCLDELFDNHTPFVQAASDEACSYCSFKSICGRKMI